MSNIDKQTLRQLADRAIPGPWEEENGEVWIMRNGTANSILTGVCGDDTSGQQDSDNARFIAAANPETVLALLDELEAAEKQIAELKSGIKSANDRYENRTPTQWAYDQACLAIEKHRTRADDAEERIAELEAREFVVNIKPPVIGRAYSALNRVWTEQEVRTACELTGIKLHIAAAGKGDK